MASKDPNNTNSLLSALQLKKQIVDKLTAENDELRENLLNEQIERQQSASNSMQVRGLMALSDMM